MKKICEYCHKEFDGKKKQQCCSRKCSNLLKHPKHKIKCDNCGKVIEVTTFQLNAYTNHYCSKKCQNEHYKIRFVGENNPHFNHDKEIVYCSVCGLIMEINNSKKYNSDGKEKKHIYCSSKCKNIHQSILNSGENNPNYGNGDKIRGELNTNYNPNITEEERRRNRYDEKCSIDKWRREVFKRDGYICQCCGKKGGNLNAHHLNAYHWDKEHRFDIDNGITLCYECHRLFHKIYTFYNNTKQQFEEFIKNFKK